MNFSFEELVSIIIYRDRLFIWSAIYPSCSRPIN